MQISINDTLLTLAPDTTLQQLLEQQAIPSQGLAIAINNTVIAKRLWPEYSLKSGDTLQLFQIVTGG